MVSQSGLEAQLISFAIFTLISITGSGCDDGVIDYYDNTIDREFVVTLFADSTCDATALYHYAIDGDLIDTGYADPMPKELNVEGGDVELRVYCDPIHSLKYWQVEVDIRSDTSFVVHCNDCEF